MTKNTTLSADTRYAKSETVPSCLRHGDVEEVLNDVQNLAAFLEDYTIALQECATSKSAFSGFLLCFELLRDKIAIAKGDLSFPMVNRSQDDELPPLWVRPGKESNSGEGQR